MRMQKSVGIVVVLGSLGVGLIALRPGHTAEQKGDGAPYVHTVIFYLKKDAPQNEPSALISDAHDLLAKIPSVRAIKAGRPAEKATRDVAIKDYQVGLAVHFGDYAGLEAYFAHAKHDEYLQRHGKYVDKILVYDFENQKK